MVGEVDGLVLMMRSLEGSSVSETVVGINVGAFVGSSEGASEGNNVGIVVAPFSDGAGDSDGSKEGSNEDEGPRPMGNVGEGLGSSESRMDWEGESEGTGDRDGVKEGQNTWVGCSETVGLELSLSGEFSDGLVLGIRLGASLGTTLGIKLGPSDGMLDVTSVSIEKKNWRLPIADIISISFCSCSSSPSNSSS